MKNNLWMNKETGELMTREQAACEATNLYDLDDTNVCGLEEYYEETDMEIPEDWDTFAPDAFEDSWDEIGFDPYEGCYTWDC